MDVLWVTTQAAALVHRLTKHLNKKEKDQANRASESMALNTAEGLGFDGANERKHLKIAYASCQEAKTSVHLLAITDQVDLEAAREAYRWLHRSGGMLYGVLRK
jgi:four helix bundle protein